MDKGEDRRPPRPQGGRPDTRRGPLRPGEAQGADSRVPGRSGSHRKAQGPHTVLRRTSRGGKDLARQVHSPRHGKEVRENLPRRRARRGRDKGTQENLHRSPSRKDHTGDEEGRNGQSRVSSRRDRQARNGFSRRPRVGASRGPRPRAELELQRPLRGGRLRPFERDVHNDRQRAPHHSVGTSGPHGDNPPAGLHRAGKARDIEKVPRG